MNRGFSLIEVAVSITIIAILVGMISPLVSRYIDEARVTRAATEAQTIASAMLNFNRDTGKWPIFQPVTGQNPLQITSTSMIYSVLYAPGNLPQRIVDSALWNPATQGSIIDQLENNLPKYSTSGKYAWRGPYLSSTASDPWNNAYLVNASNLAFGVTTVAALVISAGPNQRIETLYTQSIGTGSSAVVAGGDDIIARIR